MLILDYTVDESCFKQLVSDSQSSEKLPQLGSVKWCPQLMFINYLISDVDVQCKEFDNGSSLHIAATNLCLEGAKCLVSLNSIFNTFNECCFSKLCSVGNFVTAINSCLLLPAFTCTNSFKRGLYLSVKNMLNNICITIIKLTRKS